MLGKSTRNKAPKTQQICHYKHATKSSGLFLLYSTDFFYYTARTLVPVIAFLTQVPLQKFQLLFSL